MPAPRVPLNPFGIPLKRINEGVFTYLGKPRKSIEYQGLKIDLYKPMVLVKLLGRTQYKPVYQMEEDGCLRPGIFFNIAPDGRKFRYYTKYELLAVVDHIRKYGLLKKFRKEEKTFLYFKPLNEKWAEIESLLNKGIEPTYPINLFFQNISEMANVFKSIIGQYYRGLTDIQYKKICEDLTSYYSI